MNKCIYLCISFLARSFPTFPPFDFSLWFHQPFHFALFLYILGRESTMLNSIDKQMQFKALRREPNMSWTIYSYIYIRPSVPVVKQNMTSLGKSTLLWIWSEKNYLEKSKDFCKESWLWHMLILGRFIYVYWKKHLHALSWNITPYFCCSIAQHFTYQ